MKVVRKEVMAVLVVQEAKMDLIALDFFGNEFKLGDTVAFMQIGYRNLIQGKVISISAKELRISHAATNTCSTESKQAHSQVIKFIGQ